MTDHAQGRAPSALEEHVNGVPTEIVTWLREYGHLHRFENGTLTFGGQQMLKAADEIERLRRPSADVSGGLDAETIQTLLDLLNPLHGELDRQTYDEKVKENFDAPRDREYNVDITARMESDLTQAVLILENRKRDPQLRSPAEKVGFDINDVAIVRDFLAGLEAEELADPDDTIDPADALKALARIEIACRPSQPETDAAEQLMDVEHWKASYETATHLFNQLGHQIITALKIHGHDPMEDQSVAAAVDTALSALIHERQELRNQVERAKALLGTLHHYYCLNDCDEREDDDALEVPICDLKEASDLWLAFTSTEGK